MAKEKRKLGINKEHISKAAEAANLPKLCLKSEEFRFPHSLQHIPIHLSHQNIFLSSPAALSSL